jgi:signal transduction histidine kinase
MDVESVKGRVMTDSTQYIFRLAPPPIEEDHLAKKERTSRDATILVVEDDIHLMDGIREILELDSYKVVTAVSGYDGLERLRAMRMNPDLIVSDIMMPKMDGYQFFQAVRDEPKWVAIPFIFLTAKGEKSDIRLGKKMGADDYVTKPFGAEDLLVAVSSKLARQEQIRTAFSAQISDMKKRILTILNHEFRTPLTYVIAYADMLSRDADELSLVELKEFLTGVNTGADRLRRLISNFIFLVELETGEVDLTYAWRKRALSDYNALVKAALRNEQVVIDATRVRTRIDPSTPNITGDEEYLAGALARMIDNAEKFSEKGDEILIEIGNDTDGRVTIAVTDKGRGIPRDELDQIFDSFYQINRQQYEDQGAGSGLAIVRGVARIHSAEISVRSVEGEGSTFSLHFPPAESVNLGA